MKLVKLDTRRIIDWDSFHDTFEEVFGFPGFYGRNMNAWIDCMSYLDDPTAEMTKVHVAPGEILVLELEHVNEFAQRCPEQHAAIVECVAFVNSRMTESGQPALLWLSYSESE